MHTSENLRFYLVAQKSVNHSSLIEVKSTGATHNDTKSQDGDIPFVAVFLAHICFMIVWSMVVYLVSYTCKAAQERAQNAAEDKDEILSIKHLHQHPCENCRFFNRNYHLKCAVHPSTTLTKQALNCSDYQSH